MEIDPVTTGMIAVSLIPGYLVYQRSGIGIAALIFLLAYAFLFMARTAGPLGALSTLTNPFVTFFTVLTLAFVYFSINGDVFWLATAKSIGAGFLAGAFAMIVFNYWNIGG